MKLRGRYEAEVDWRSSYQRDALADSIAEPLTWVSCVHSNEDKWLVALEVILEDISFNTVFQFPIVEIP